MINKLNNQIFLFAFPHQQKTIFANSDFFEVSKSGQRSKFVAAIIAEDFAATSAVVAVAEGGEGGGTTPAVGHFLKRVDENGVLFRVVDKKAA